MTPFKKIHPLDLPEIRTHLSKFIPTKKDLLSCLCVSQAWHETFAPLIWSTPSIGHEPYPPGKRLQYANIAGIRRNAHFIRSLRFAFPNFRVNTYAGMRFDRLDKLASRAHQGTWPVIASLVRNSPVLSELTIAGLMERLPKREEDALSLWGAVEEAPMLSTIALKEIDMGGVESTTAFWNACRRTRGGQGIQVLRLCNVTFNTIGSEVLVDDYDYNSDEKTKDGGDGEKEKKERKVLISSTMLLPTSNLDSVVEFELIGYIHSKLTPMDQLKLQQKLPGVKKLNWGTVVEFKKSGPAFVENCLLIFQRLAKKTATTTMPISSDGVDSCISSEDRKDEKEEVVWPLVEDLTLPELAVSDECLSLMIECLRRPLSRLSVDGSYFGVRSFDRLVGGTIEHCATIRVLSLRSCQGVTSSMVQEIMELCPLLEELTADGLKFKDVVRGQAWTCVGLRRLEVFVDVDSGDLDESMENPQKQTLARIGRLQRLEHLSMGRKSYEVVYSNAIVLRLHAGLEALQGLDRLQSIDLEGSRQEMDRGDVEWMMKHWPRLNYIRSNICSDSATRIEVREYLESRRVNVHYWRPS
ncbi:MAG: hypothetical protein J3R72DRAFT_458034, partial [Linnemannia gamsii]